MGQQHRPFLLTADAELLDDLLGVAAAVGAALDVGVEPSACRPQWTEAPLVLVGADLIDATLAARLEPRRGVMVVGRGAPSADLRRLATSLGADETVVLPTGEGRVLERLADAVEPAARSARVIAVLPGRGGAGASALAAGLALTAAVRRDPAWLIDLDPLGGGADAGLGAELAVGARWSDLGVVVGRLSPRSLRAALTGVHGVAVLAADGPADSQPDVASVRAVIAAARRSAGTVVLDLARHRTPARDEALAAADDILVVVPDEVRSVVAARRVIDDLGTVGAPARAVVRKVVGGLPSPEVLPALGLPLAGELADEATVRTALQVGDPHGLIKGTALGRLCETLLDRSEPMGAAA